MLLRIDRPYRLMRGRMVGVNLGDGTHAVVQARKILLSEDAGDASRFAQNYVADWPGVAVTSVDERRRARALLQEIMQPFELAAASPAKNIVKLERPPAPERPADRDQIFLAANGEDIDPRVDEETNSRDDDRGTSSNLGM